MRTFSFQRFCIPVTEHGVMKYVNLIGPLRESISLRITLFTT